MELSQEEALKEAVHWALSPTATPAQRQQAYLICDSFKTNAAENTQLLFSLLDDGNTEPVRHFGLQVVEHVIKQFWNDLPSDGKFRLKTVCVSLIHQMDGQVPVFLSDGIAKCIVEIVKREWPQQWPTFIEEMGSICSRGECDKTDLVMRILLRLAEDVVILNTVRSQRRRDIQMAMNSSLVTIVPFLITTLESNITAYKSAPVEAREHLLRVTKSTLETVMGYVSWCDAALIKSNNNQLIGLLYGNLSVVGIQLSCVECLYILSQRHGNVESVSPILPMFHESSLHLLRLTIEEENGKPPNSVSHTFLKRLSQLMISMGAQICNLRHKEGKKFELPPSFPKYAMILHQLTTHPSMFISSACLELWNTIFRTAGDQEFLKQISLEIAKLALIKLRKVGAPDDPSHPFSYYARLDYDSERDWLDSFYRHKSTMLNLLQILLPFCEPQIFDIAVTELRRLLDLSQQAYSGETVEACDPKSSLFIEWEALNAYLHAIGREMSQDSHTWCIEPFQMLLNTTVKEPQLLGVMLSALSALFPVVTSVPRETFDYLLVKIFDYAQYNSSPSAICAHKELSHHAGAVFIRLATLHPTLLTSKFGELHKYVISCKNRVDSRTLRCLMEGLLLVSNEMKSFSKQVEYIEKILEESLEKWKNPQLLQSFQSSTDMARYIGLLSPPDSDPDFRARRFQLQELLRDFLMVTRRVTTPTDLTVAATGGYVGDSGVIQSPSASVLLSQLNNILLCLNSVYGLYKPDIMKLFHEGFPPSVIMELPECERTLLTTPAHLGVPEEKRVGKTDYVHLQKHVLEVADSINQLLVFLCKLGSEQFYRVPNMADMVSHIVVTHLNEVNSFAFKNMIKYLIKPLCLNCPVELRGTFVSTILGRTLPPIINRLEARWKQRNQLPQNAGEDGEGREDMPDNEIIEDELLRLTSRELLEAFIGLFIESPHQKSRHATQKSDEAEIGVGDVEMADNEDVKLSQTPNSRGDIANVTEFIQNLPQDEVVYLLWLSTNCSCWLDSPTSMKSSDLVLPLIKHLKAVGALTADIAEQVIRSLLTAVHLHGQHDSISIKLCSCILGAYELLRPEFVSLTSTMLQIPGVTEISLQQFEKDIGLNPPIEGGKGRSHNAIKKKRDRLRLLIWDIIGKNVSEQFKERVVIKNLPPLVKKKIRRSTDLIAANVDDSTGLCHLFTPS